MTDIDPKVTIERDLLQLPQVITPPDTASYCVKVPNDAQYIRNFFSLLEVGSRWFNWQRTGDRQGADAAKRWREMVAGITPGCAGEQNECTEYYPLSDFIQWEPSHPRYTGTPPTGYAKNPWITGGGLGAPGTVNTDIYCDIFSSLPETIFDIPAFIINSGLPRFRVNFEGPAEIELHLLKVPQGGYGLITLDGDPLTADIVDLASITATEAAGVGSILELIDAALEGQFWQVQIYEKKTLEPGMHYLDVTMVPVAELADGIPIPIPAWGGGLRKVVICSPNAPPCTTTIESVGVDLAGKVSFFATEEPPDGWLLCDGATYLNADYPELAAVIADNLKVGFDMFQVPDLIGGYASGTDTIDEIGDETGQNSVMLSAQNLPEHEHARNPYAFPENIPTARTQNDPALPVTGGDAAYLYSWAVTAGAISSRGYTSENVTGTNYQLPTDPLPQAPVSTRPKSTLLLPCICYRDLRAIEGLKGVPGEKGEPGDCDCDGTETPEYPPITEVPPGAEGLSVKCVAANNAASTLFDLTKQMIFAVTGVSSIVAFAGVLITILLIIVSVGAATPALFALAAAIIAIGSGGFVDEFSTENLEKFVCILHRFSDETGRYDDNGYDSVIEALRDVGESDDFEELAGLLALVLSASRTVGLNNATTIPSEREYVPCDCVAWNIVRPNGSNVGIEYLGNGRWSVSSIQNASTAINDAIIEVVRSDGGCWKMTNITVHGSFPSASGWSHTLCNGSTIGQRHPTPSESVKILKYIRVPFANYRIEFNAEGV